MPTSSRSISAQALGKGTRFLARHVRTRSLTAREPRPLVTFTFDDVPLSTCVTGAQILERHGVRGTFYVSGGGCGMPSPCGLLASPEHLAAVAARGHEIGCHTYSHPAVSQIALDGLRADLDRNASFLRGVLGRRLRNFAYPYGDQTFRAKRYLQSRFDSCRSLVPGINAGATDLGTLKANCMNDVAAQPGALDALIAETVRRRGWLVLAGHDVADVPSAFGATPAFLAHVITTARSAGCEIVTVAGALDAMAGVQTSEVAA